MQVHVFNGGAGRKHEGAGRNGPRTIKGALRNS